MFQVGDIFQEFDFDRPHRGTDIQSNTEQFPDNNGNRKTIFDIACIISKGEHFAVEMQKAETVALQGSGFV